MIEKDLNKLLNYMKQYVENKYEHDSEPMLNWKDLKLLLDEIERLNKRVKECEEAYLRTRHQYSELEGKYVIDEHIIKEVRETLINSKEYKIAKEMNLTSKMSVLIEILEIVDKENK